MSDYDGEVKLRMVLTADGVKEAARRLSSELDNVVNTSGVEKLDAKFAKLAGTMDKLRTKATTIIDEMEKLEDTKIPTETYANLQKVLDSLDTQIDKTREKMTKMEAIYEQRKETIRNSIEAKTEELNTLEARLTEAGRAVGDGVKGAYEHMNKLFAQQREVKADIASLTKSLEHMGPLEETKAYQSLVYDVKQIIAKREEIVSEMMKLEDSGKAFSTGADSDRYQQLTEQLEQVNNAMRTTQAQADALTENATQNSEKVTEKVEEVKQKIKETRHEAGRPAAAHGMFSEMNLKKMIKLFVKWGLGIRSTFILIRKVRAAAKESLKVMASYDSTLNSKISKLLTNLKQMKADIGTMLEPLVQTFAPLLDTLLGKVHSLMLELSKFFAALVGQDYISVATVKAVDYADSLDDVAESAEKANKALGAYDKLNLIGQETDDKAKDAKSTLALTKETVEYTKQMLDPNSWTVRLGKRIRELFTWVGDKLGAIKDWLLSKTWIQTIISNLKETLKDPDGFLTLIGATLIISKLASKIKTSVSGATSAGVAGATFGQILLTAVVAIAGYKIGNKIWESLPEGLQDELANQIEVVVNVVRGTISEVPEVVKEYGDAGKENGPKGVLEKWGDNIMEFLDEIFGGLPGVDAPGSTTKEPVVELDSDSLEKYERSLEYILEHPLETITRSIVNLPGNLKALGKTLVSSIDDLENRSRMLGWYNKLGIVDDYDENNHTGTINFEKMLKVSQKQWDTIPEDLRPTDQYFSAMMLPYYAAGGRTKGYGPSELVDQIPDLRRLATVWNTLFKGQEDDMLDPYRNWLAWNDPESSGHALDNGTKLFKHMISLIDEEKNKDFNLSDWVTDNDQTGILGDVTLTKKGPLQSLFESFSNLGKNITEVVKNNFMTEDDQTDMVGSLETTGDTLNTVVLTSSSNSAKGLRRVGNIMSELIAKSFSLKGEKTAQMSGEIASTADTLSGSVAGGKTTTGSKVKAIGLSWVKAIANAFKFNKTDEEQLETRSVSAVNTLDARDEGTKLGRMSKAVGRRITSAIFGNVKPTETDTTSVEKALATAPTSIVESLKQGNGALTKGIKSLGKIMGMKSASSFLISDEEQAKISATVAKVMTGVGTNAKKSGTDLYRAIDSSAKLQGESLSSAFKKYYSQDTAVMDTASSKGTDLASSMTSAFQKQLKAEKTIKDMKKSVSDLLSKSVPKEMSIDMQLSSMIQSGVDKVLQMKFLNVPKLAQGAVIPANNQFLAMLGDQKSGTNIEAPLDTIVQAMMTALKRQGTGQTIVLNVDGKKMAKVVWDATAQEWRQTGTNPWETSFA